MFGGNVTFFGLSRRDFLVPDAFGESAESKRDGRESFITGRDLVELTEEGGRRNRSGTGENGLMRTLPDQ